MMNGYKAFYKGKEMDVWAPTSLEAQREAAKKFKAKKDWEVTVVLCLKDVEGGYEQVVHTPVD
jgi:hypothetical protein